MKDPVERRITMQGLRRLAPAAIGVLVAVLAAGMVAAGTARAVTRSHAGECGEYKYWHNGKCVDARDRSGRPWTSAVY
jgi:hypothetical protein